MRILLLAILLFVGCAPVLKTPKVYVRPARQTLTTRATLAEAKAARPVVYFASFDARVKMYRIEYLTPSGKVPFLTVFRPASTIKDTVRAAPCYVRVQALGKDKSHWSKLIYVD